MTTGVFCGSSVKHSPQTSRAISQCDYELEKGKYFGGGLIDFGSELMLIHGDIK